MSGRISARDTSPRVAPSMAIANAGLALRCPFASCDRYAIDVSRPSASAFFSAGLSFFQYSISLMAETLAPCYCIVNSPLLVPTPTATRYAPRMDIKTIRRNNLRALIARHGSQKQLADDAGLSVAHVSHMNTGHRAVGDKIARQVEQQLGLPFGWMDVAEHPDNHTAEPASAYDAVTDAEIAEALHKYSSLDHAFRQYILIKMEELLTYSRRLSPFLRQQLRAPGSDNYREWEKEMENDIARLRAQNNHNHQP